MKMVLLISTVHCLVLCVEHCPLRHKVLTQKNGYNVIATLYLGDIASLKQRLKVLFPDKGLDKILPTDTGTVVISCIVTMIIFTTRYYQTLLCCSTSTIPLEKMESKE